MIELHVYLMIEINKKLRNFIFYFVCVCGGWGEAWSVQFSFNIIYIRGINILLLFCMYIQCYFIV